MYLSEEEMNDLLEFVEYEKIYLLLIEYVMPSSCFRKNGCIIDKDCCIIDLGDFNLQH